MHLILTLNTAQTLFFKLKNFKTCSSFARRLLELGPKPELATKSKKILQACDKSPTDAVDLDYDQHNPFNVCGKTYKPIYKGSPMVKCAYCSAAYVPSLEGQVCTVCRVGKIGGTSIGGLAALRFG